MLMQRRERSRHDQSILLPDQSGARPRRPNPLLDRVAADAFALSVIAIGPDVNQFVERPELRIPASRERRQPCARFNLLTPPLDNRGDSTGLVGVGANLINVAERTFLQR